MTKNEARRARRIETESKAWDLRQLGHSVREIATELGVHYSTVSRCLARVEGRVLKRLGDESDHKKVEADAILDEIRCQALRAWERSQKPSNHITKITTPGGRERTIQVVENRDGDPRFLEVALEATHKLSLLWGVYAPTKLKVEAQVGLSVSAVAARLKANMEAYEADQGRLEGPDQDPPDA